MKYKFKTTPYKHQVKALKRALKQEHIAVLWEPGTGKTKFSIDWVSALHTADRASRVLIVCPLSVVGVWEEEFELHCPIDYNIQLFDRKTKAIDLPADALQVVVANYDIAWRRKPIIEGFKPQVVIADESHRIKKASTKRSWFMRSMNTVPYRAILTGTPTPKSLLDLYGQWVFLNPKRFGTRVNDFKERYLIYGGYMRHEIRGYSNVEELKRKVRADATIRRKDQCLDLPPKVFQRVPCILEPEARRLYDELAEEFYVELTSGETVDAANAAVKVLRLQQITGGFVNTDEGIRQVSHTKLAVLQGLLEDLHEQQRKVVIFTRFIPEVEAIGELCERVGYRLYTLRGSTPREERDANRRAFQANDEAAVFLAQISTGGLGITLHSAHEAIFYTPTYALDEYIQACDRLHRSGQTNKVTYRHLVAVNSVDTEIYRALKNKEDVMKVIMGDPDRLLPLDKGVPS